MNTSESDSAQFESIREYTGASQIRKTNFVLYRTKFYRLFELDGVVKRVLLEKIESPDGEVEFNTILVEDIDPSMYRESQVFNNNPGGYELEPLPVEEQLQMLKDIHKILKVSPRRRRKQSLPDEPFTINI